MDSHKVWRSSPPRQGERARVAQPAPSCRAGPILATTGLVFGSCLGVVKIAAVAAEIRDPARKLPRALIGSVVLVTALYMVILLVVAGIFPQATIQEVRDPLTAAARLMLGTPGGWAIITAGLLATVSSATASIMAASRINLAMARDGLIPEWLSAVFKGIREGLGITRSPKSVAE